MTSFSAFDQEHQWRTATPQNEPIERPTPEMTETQTSYNTAPELSKPVEHLFDALLRQERTIEQEDTEVLTIKTEMATDASMGGGLYTPPLIPIGFQCFEIWVVCLPFLIFQSDRTPSSV